MGVLQWVGIGLAVGWSLSGCVRVYQPLSGLHEPAVVDPTVANLADVHLTVRCAPGGLLTQQEASLLCRRVGTLFENQGATVRTTIGLYDDPEDLEEEEPEEGQAAEAPRTDLVMELRARQLHKSQYPVSWVLCVSTFTLMPWVREESFAQEVTIRDERGFLLVSKTLEGRLIERFGAGAWVSEKLLDLSLRRERDKVSGQAAEAELSADLYQQLSQLAFNAKIQREILVESAQTAVP